MAIVYRHIRVDKNEPFYIGIGKTEKRAYEKIKRNQFWHNVIAKTDYEVEILFDDLSWENAEEKEKELIKLYGKRDNNTGCLVNITDGGGGRLGVRHTEESRKKIGEESRNRKRTPRSAETKEKLRLANLGKVGKNLGMKHTEATKLKLRLANLGKVGPNKGRPMTEEAKQKMIASKLGKESKLKGTTISEETKNKVSIGLKRYFANKRLNNDK
jgi:hypothetical protein